MSRLVDVSQFATTMPRDKVVQSMDCAGWHESLLRSYHIVQEVRMLLELGTPPSVVLMCMDVMEGK